MPWLSASCLQQRTASITILAEFGRVPHLELELRVQWHVSEGLTFQTDVRPFAVGQPRHVVRGADVDIVGGQLVVSHDWTLTALVLEIFLDLQPLTLEHVL